MTIWFGEGETPVPDYASLPELVAAAARDRGEQIAVTCVLPNGWETRLTYRELHAASDAVGRYITDRISPERGAVAAIQAPNVTGYPIVLLGALKAGMAVSGVNPLFTAPETRRQIKECNAELFIGFDLFAEQINSALSDINIPKIILSAGDGMPLLRRTALSFLTRYVKRVAKPLTVKHVVWSDVIAEGETLTTLLPEPLADDEPAFYQFSGGTTGVPKGVTLTTKGLLTNILQVSALSPDELRKEGRCALLVLPLYHMYGVFMLATVLSTGGHLVLAPSPRPLSNLRAAFSRYRPDIFPGVNTLFAGLLEEAWFDGDIATSIEITFSGATALNEAVRERWSARTGSVTVESYGMTEATTVLTTNPLGERNRPGTVGIPVPGVSIRIVKDDGTAAPPGERGELQARGPQIMKGYLNAPDLTEATFDDGWLRTGDIAVVDDDGYVRIVDRLKDMIIVSGFNVYPGEIEEVIASVEGVRDVGVVGAPDDHSGEVPVAFVVADDRINEDGLKKVIAEQLTAYKRPRRYEFVDDLPKSAVGKVLRRELRAML